MKSAKIITRKIFMLYTVAKNETPGMNSNYNKTTGKYDVLDGVLQSRKEVEEYKIICDKIL